MKPKRLQNKALLKQVRSRKCLICGKNSDACHLKTRGSGGDDVPENLLSLCREHHQEQGSWGFPRFCRTYPVVMFELDELGWKLETLFGRERLVRR